MSMSRRLSRQSGYWAIAFVALLGACSRGGALEDGWAVEEYRYGDYRFELRKREDGDDILTLYRADDPLLTVVRAEVRLENDPTERPTGLSLGADITGDGEPNAVVRTGNGGGFDGVIVLEIGERFRELARIDSMEGEIALQDLDERPGLEIAVRDKPIRSWVTDNRETRTPFVVFAHDGEAYRVAEDLMRRPPLDEGEWAAALRLVRAETSAEGRPRPPPVLWRIVMELIYGGNMTQAWSFVDAAWHPDWWREEEPISEAILCEVQGSRYWPQIAALNGLDSEEPALDECRRWGPARDWTHAQYRIGEYVLALEKQKISNDRLVVYRAGEIVYFIADQRIYLDFFPSVEPREIPLGTDVTGDGRPNALFETWSGGAHCCITLVVLEIGARFREVARIGGLDSEFIVEDLDGRPGLEIKMRDAHYVYWKASAAGSYMPLVILAYDGEAYRMAAELMRRPPPGEGEWAALIRAVREDDKGYAFSLETPPPALWRVMLDLIYSGNMAQARPFLDAAWRPHWPRDGETFYRVFLCRLQGSPHWPDIARLNGLASPRLMPEDCDDEHSENG